MGSYLKPLLLFVASFFVSLASHASSSSSAPVYVHGYFKANGTYVAPHYRSAPNSTTADNYSTKGNVNPYTGAPGTKNGDSAVAAPAGTSLDAASGTLAAPAPTSGPGIATSTAAPNAAASPTGNADMATIAQQLQLISNRLANLESRMDAIEHQPSAANSAIPAGLANWRRISPGTSMEQVRSFLGEPSHISWPFWYYPRGGQVMFLTSGTVYQWTEPNVR